MNFPLNEFLELLAGLSTPTEDVKTELIIELSVVAVVCRHPRFLLWVSLSFRHVNDRRG